ncbi:MAG TPA: OmpH family outer membrane protein [Saprospiraceae bacterium]|nr:OmpH family outer membrane protein [Saprospiraceae bacterium]
MKYFSRLLLLAAISFVSFSQADAQKVCYINLEKVLNTVEDYKNAQQEIDQIAQKWQQEIDREREKIKSLYNRYQAEQVLWSEETRQKKEEEIVELEDKVREMYEQRFGPEGALFKKRQELIRPIQEKVYAVIETYAVERGYDFIYDVNTAAGLLYTNNRYDKTDDIIRRVRY